MSVSRNNELLRANQSYSTKCFFISCPSPWVHFIRQGAFLSLGEQLSLPLRASEVYSVSEVDLVSEVSPAGEVMGKLNFTWCIKVTKQLCTNFTASQLHFRVSENFTFPRRPIYIFDALWYNLTNR